MSYGFSQYIPLSKEEILSRVSQEDIFKIVFEDVLEGEYYTAPYRTDSTPDCYFEYLNGTLFFVDFANTLSNYTNLTCFDVVQLKYGFNFIQCLQYINEVLDIGLGSSSTINAKPIIFKEPVIVERKEKIKKDFLIYPREFNYADRLYWEPYGVTKQQLIDDKVFPLELFQTYTKEGRFFSVAPFKVCYAYTDFPDNRVKVYQPYKTSKTGKWFTNCSASDVGNINDLPEQGDTLIISKSYKDCRVLRNLGYTSIWFQNEGMFPPKEILKDLLQRFKNIYVMFDNDETGIQKSNLLCKVLRDLTMEIGSRIRISLVSLPINDKDAKDPADYYKLIGRGPLEDFLNSKIPNK